tara:strand:+ start:738 stop:1406 length:669 start_codon:yes stop_codon:yes gene_type:complete
MEVKFKFLYILFLYCLFGYEKHEYKIKSFGVPVAKCFVTISDTIYDNQINTLLRYEVKTLNIFNTFYPIKNEYLIIIDDNYTTKYFEKNTIQPNIQNYIKTTSRNGKTYYYDTEYLIPPKTLNIFSLLYALVNDSINKSYNKSMLEREGKFYFYSIKTVGQKYILDLNPIDDDNGVIEHTDIFTWALFKANVQRTIILNDNRIEKCVVKSGFLNFTAEYVHE